MATVAADVLHVRAAPTTDSAIIGSRSQGDMVEIVGAAEAGFVPVRHEDRRGWMAVEFLGFDRATFSIARNPVQPTVASAAEHPESETQAEVFAVEQATLSNDSFAELDVAAEPAERWIDINRTTATVPLYVGVNAIASFSGKIGRDQSADGFYSTAVGTFHVYSMNKGLASTPYADDTYLSDWVGFDSERNNGIHSPVRDEFGVEKSWQNPTTLGCVRLGAEAAARVFEFAAIGMRVEVHD